MATRKYDIAQRYTVVTEEKACGVIYTPKLFADFVAKQIIGLFNAFPVDRPLRILDPAIGDGQLLVSLLEYIGDTKKRNIEIYGFETDQKAINNAYRRLKQKFPDLSFNFKTEDFLEYVLKRFGTFSTDSLFAQEDSNTYDLIIANPPYVRTQIIGSHKAQVLSRCFGLSGRVDLYYAFILAITQVLGPKGIAGIIVSNRFMSTLSGATVRRALIERVNLRHIWDLGDSKLFEAAVLPAVLLAEGKNGHKQGLPSFTSIYETRQIKAVKSTNALSPLEALTHDGIVKVGDGRQFLVKHGKLNTEENTQGIWRVANKTTDAWLTIAKDNTWKTFKDVGKICVGVKTCADKIFINSDWCNMRAAERPELLRPLITHHIARRFKALEPEIQRQILYPYVTTQGQRHPVNLARYPNSKFYLETHREILENRKYLIEAGREWYEIWVPHDPTDWNKTKLVFRDIVEKPTFWIDRTGAVVNGDCYWMVSNKPNQSDILWLAAAVGNTHFIEWFYDSCFHNKLYAGRRRFMAQYVEKFPLPDPTSAIGKAIIAGAQEIYACISSSKAEKLQIELEQMVWSAFGLSVEKVTG